jgi:hypothetical protein
MPSVNYRTFLISLLSHSSGAAFILPFFPDGPAVSPCHNFCLELLFVANCAMKLQAALRGLNAAEPDAPGTLRLLEGMQQLSGSQNTLARDLLARSSSSRRGISKEVAAAIGELHWLSSSEAANARKGLERLGWSSLAQDGVVSPASPEGRKILELDLRYHVYARAFPLTDCPLELAPHTQLNKALPIRFPHNVPPAFFAPHLNPILQCVTAAAELGPTRPKLSQIVPPTLEPFPFLQFLAGRVEDRALPLFSKRAQSQKSVSLVFERSRVHHAVACTEASPRPPC